MSEEPSKQEIFEHEASWNEDGFSKTGSVIYAWRTITAAIDAADEVATDGETTTLALPAWCVDYLRATAGNLQRLAEDAATSPTECAAQTLRAAGIISDKKTNAFKKWRGNERSRAALVHRSVGKLVYGGDTANAQKALLAAAKLSADHVAPESLNRNLRRIVQKSRS